MKVKEIRQKSDKELQKLLLTLRDKLRDLRFKIASKQLKNYKEMGKIKRDVAKILTVIKERKLIKEIKAKQ